MKNIFVQYENQNNTKIISVFGSPQSNAVKNQGVTDSSDPLYKEFYDGIPLEFRDGLPPPE